MWLNYAKYDQMLANTSVFINLVHLYISTCIGNQHNQVNYAETQPSNTIPICYTLLYFEIMYIYCFDI